MENNNGLSKLMFLEILNYYNCVRMSTSCKIMYPIVTRLNGKSSTIVELLMKNVL